MSNYSASSLKQDPNSSWYKIFQMIPERSEVLDVGCSSGNFGAELIKQKKCTVDGIEIDDSDFQKAKRKLNKVYKLNVEKPLALKKKYDFVYFGDVIEHLVDPVAALKNVQAVLKPEGKILFSIPNMTHVGVRLLLLSGEFEYSETGLLDKTHLHFYSQEEVYRVFEEAGYQIDHFDFIAKDLPKEVITKKLAELGLKANEEFYTAMTEPRAAAFQFVGSAERAARPKKRKRLEFGPVDLYDKHIRDVVKDLNMEIDRLRSLISVQKAQIEQQEQALNHVRESLPWRVWTVVRKFTGKDSLN